MIFSQCLRLLGFRGCCCRNARKAQYPLYQPQARLSLEPLEGRWVPAILHVGSQVGEVATIQQAIEQANPGDTIMVDPGTYQEQLTISTNTSGVTLNNLTIESTTGPQITTIQLPSSAPAATTTAIVEITGAANVTIKGFTISGPGNGTTGSIGYGVEVDGGGSALILSNQITQIEDSPIGSSQNGVGIEIGNASTKQVGSARIWGNTIYDYQKEGIDISGGGSSATINNNTVIGQGPISSIAQNGVQVDTGANAWIINNRILNNLYVPTTYNGTGIILETPGKVTITNNVIENNDVGIGSYGATGVDIAVNIIVNNYDNGIVLYQTSDSIVQANVVNKNGSFHYDVVDLIVDGGIVLYDSTGNAIEHNVASGNTVGYYADVDSSSNSFNYNIMSCSLIFGAEDLSGGTGTAHTANFWHGNNLGTANNPKLLLS